MLLGDVGAGQFGKAMNNFLLWVNGVALIEAGRLAEANGMDLVKLREALLISSGASDALKNWENVSFLWALKDMQIVVQDGRQGGAGDADRRRHQGTGQGRPAHQADQSAGLDRQRRQAEALSTRKCAGIEPLQPDLAEITLAPSVASSILVRPSAMTSTV